MTQPVSLFCKYECAFFLFFTQYSYGFSNTCFICDAMTLTTKCQTYTYCSATTTRMTKQTNSNNVGDGRKPELTVTLLSSTHELNLACHTYYMQTAFEADSFYLTDIIGFDLEKLFGHVLFCRWQCVHQLWRQRSGRVWTQNDSFVSHVRAPSAYINR